MPSWRLKSVYLVAATAATLVVTPAAAEQQGDAQPGNILLISEVGPRNAVVPGNGASLAVRVSPDPRIFGIVPNTVRVLDDVSASGVTADRPGIAAGGLIGLSLGSDLGTMIAGPTNSESARGGGIGGTISGAIGLGMGAVRGALGSFKPGGGQ